MPAYPSYPGDEAVKSVLSVAHKFQFSWTTYETVLLESARSRVLNGKGHWSIDKLSMHKYVVIYRCEVELLQTTNRISYLLCIVVAIPVPLRDS